MSRSNHSQGALTPAMFHILLALYEGIRHGLGIADEVEESTAGAMRLGPGTLYRSLKEMTKVGLVDEACAPKDEDPRRKFYRITGKGRELVRAEAARYEAIVKVARDVLPQTK